MKNFFKISRGQVIFKSFDNNHYSLKLLRALLYYYYSVGLNKSANVWRNVGHRWTSWSASRITYFETRAPRNQVLSQQHSALCPRQRGAAILSALLSESLARSFKRVDQELIISVSVSVRTWVSPNRTITISVSCITTHNGYKFISKFITPLLIICLLVVVTIRVVLRYLQGQIINSLQLEW